MLLIVLIVLIYYNQIELLYRRLDMRNVDTSIRPVQFRGPNQSRYRGASW